jgi:hypothetical protein
MSAQASLSAASGTQVFAEARYNRIIMGQFHTDYVPVTFGFRW